MSVALRLVDSCKLANATHVTSFNVVVAPERNCMTIHLGTETEQQPAWPGRKHRFSRARRRDSQGFFGH
jgi:hypothetical protein